MNIGVRISFSILFSHMPPQKLNLDLARFFGMYENFLGNFLMNFVFISANEPLGVNEKRDLLFLGCNPSSFLYRVIFTYLGCDAAAHAGSIIVDKKQLFQILAETFLALTAALF